MCRLVEEKEVKEVKVRFMVSCLSSREVDGEGHGNLCGARLGESMTATKENPQPTQEGSALRINSSFQIIPLSIDNAVLHRIQNCFMTPIFLDFQLPHL